VAAAAAAQCSGLQWGSSSSIRHNNDIIGLCHHCRYHHHLHCCHCHCYHVADAAIAVAVAFAIAITAATISFAATFS